MKKRLALPLSFATISFVAMGGVSISPTLVASQPYSYNWTGGLTAPVQWRPADWDVFVHQRQTNITFPQMNPMQAQHGANCAAPPATHPISTAPDSVFICNNHLMTAIDGSDYGVIYLTPSQEVDFASGASITYSQSTSRSSLRDWTDIWITPFGENLVAPLESWLPDLQGPPKDAVHIKMDTTNGGTIFKAEVYTNFNATAVDCCSTKLLENFISTSAAIRTGFELDLTPTHIKFGIPSIGLWWIDGAASIPFTRGIVQIGHHSYNPSKDCSSGNIGSTPGCPPATWHWSNFAISNAVPFTMLKPSVPDFVGASTATFPTPAPQGSFLRFSALGLGLLVSLNGGSFIPAIQAKELGQSGSIHDEHVKDYWMAIPAGTTSVAFRGGPWPGGDTFRVQDLAIWSEGGSTPPPPPSPAPTPTPTVVPTPTPSPLPITISNMPCTVVMNGVAQNGTCTGTFVHS